MHERWRFQQLMKNAWQPNIFTLDRKCLKCTICKKHTTETLQFELHVYFFGVFVYIKHMFILQIYIYIFGQLGALSEIQQPNGFNCSLTGPVLQEQSYVVPKLLPKWQPKSLLKNTQPLAHRLLPVQDICSMVHPGSYWAWGEAYRPIINYILTSCN